MIVVQVDGTATGKLCMEYMYTNFTKCVYDTNDLVADILHNTNVYSSPCSYIPLATCHECHSQLTQYVATYRSCNDLNVFSYVCLYVFSFLRIS